MERNQSPLKTSSQPVVPNRRAYGELGGQPCLQSALGEASLQAALRLQQGGVYLQRSLGMGCQSACEHDLQQLVAETSLKQERDGLIG